MTVPTEAVSVCKTGAPPETSTMLLTSPISSVTSMRFELPTCTSRLLRSTARNPESSAFKLYTPGGIARRTYNPASFVNAVRTAFVDGLVNVTVTPGTSAPLGSLITPLISPVGACAARLKVNRLTKNNVANDRPNIDTSCDACPGGQFLRLRAIALALRGPPPQLTSPCGSNHFRYATDAGVARIQIVLLIKNPVAGFGELAVFYSHSIADCTEHSAIPI